MKPGDKVRLTEAVKYHLITTGSHEHVEEFGNCIGVVIELTDWGYQKGPEWDVRWHPSGLRYAYAAEDLELVQGDPSWWQIFKAWRRRWKVARELADYYQKFPGEK